MVVETITGAQMKDHIVAEVAVVPLGTGNTSLSHFVAGCIDELESNSGISYQLTPMGTIVEGELDTVLAVVKKLHEIPFANGACRVLTTLKIDDRRDKKITMRGKVAAVMEKCTRVGPVKK